MIKSLIVIILFGLGFAPLALAQDATIVDLKGKVFIRENTHSAWQTATIEMRISQNATIATEADSSCTLAFDEKKKNILKIDENTEVTVKSILPGRVFLPEGRVFSLIKDLDEIEKFEVQTPTAVSGARGTGWLTEVTNGKTKISCFNDAIFVNSLDPNGAVTGQITITEGSGVKVEDQPVSQDAVKELDEENVHQWHGFLDSVRPWLPPEMLGPRPPGDKPLPPPDGAHGEHPQETPPNFDQMMMEAHKQLEGDPEKLAQFDQMIQEGYKKFGADFEKLLMSGGAGNEEFRTFMHELASQFGDQFNPVHFEGRQMYPNTTNSGSAAGPYPTGTAQPGKPPEHGLPPPGGNNPPPPPGGDQHMPPPPDGNTMLDPNGWNTGPTDPTGNFPNDPLHDAQHEVNQTMIDTNLAMCGHYCCPHPQCCSIFPMGSADNYFCRTH